MKIALAQINPTVGDFTGNTQKILEYAARAAEQGADLAVFPELAVCGYPPADFLEKTAFVERACQAVDEIAAWTATPGRPALLVGSVMPDHSPVGKRVRNVAVLLSGGNCASHFPTPNDALQPRPARTADDITWHMAGHDPRSPIDLEQMIE